jgi:hypothetical protein
MLPVFPNKSLQVRDTELAITLAQAYQKSFRSFALQSTLSIINIAKGWNQNDQLQESI